MFPKPHHQPPPHSQPFPRSFSVAATPPPRDSPASADEDSAAGPSPLAHAMVLKEPTSTGDGASIEVVRRPRGRPPGSKNKPKPAAVVVAGREAEPAMSPYVLEVPGGSDVVESISRFCRRRNTGLCILNAYGTVADSLSGNRRRLRSVQSLSMDDSIFYPSAQLLFLTRRRFQFLMDSPSR